MLTCRLITIGISLSLSLIAPTVHAFGQIAQVVDASNFCIFMPPTNSVNRNIADTEWNAEAFCLGSAPKAKNAGKLNDGFILSAHYASTDDYVQITGQMDPKKGNLNITDDGGQYDIKAPKGSLCAGWQYYVNLIEPTTGTYCMRCCNDPKTCNRGISEKGCAYIIPGDYNGPNDSSKSAKVDVVPSKFVITSSIISVASPTSSVTQPKSIVASTASASSHATSKTKLLSTSTVIPSDSSSSVAIASNSASSVEKSSPTSTPNSVTISQDNIISQSINVSSGHRSSTSVSYIVAGILASAFLLV
ncbi:hypothetical protein BDF14DRAFT_1848630 [Spinellus fusiger]|nr:hypothetical protein BDF14DRAFT_1848630 [Spinellus fusiger]